MTNSAIHPITEFFNNNIKGAIHVLKLHCCYFDSVVEGKKNFEVRFNDRDYKVGDVIILGEWDETSKIYTGRRCAAEITYVLKENTMMASGYAVLGIKLV